MDSHLKDLKYPVSLSHEEQELEEFRKAEAAVARSLENIRSLYNEIMTPKSYPVSDLETYLDFESEPFEYEYSVDTPTVSKIHKEQNSKSSNNCARCCTLQSYSSLTNTLQYCKNCQKSNNWDNIYPLNRKKSNSSSVLFEELNTAPKISCDVKNVYARSNITVPKPFSLTEKNIKRQQAKELKISKLKEQLNNETEKELKVKITTKPVPKHVRLPLYNEMVKRNERRKIERKEQCMEVIQKMAKPFDLSYCKKETSKSKSVSDMNKEESDQFFKAKPLPKKILDENVSKKLKDKQEIRKMMMAQRAEDLLKQSSLPFSPKHIPSSYSMYNISKEEKQNNTKVEKPDIAAITKRLYTIKCEKAMEDWNNKILQNDLWREDICISQNNSGQKHNKSNSKPKFQVVNTLPFYRFPVRMSTAAALRENCIREELLRRKKREETDETIKEEIARKKKELVKNIWPRLKSQETAIDYERNIEEKVKSYRASQKSREQEYDKELEEMMERVSRQFLLIERQSKEPPKEVDINATQNEEKVSDKQGTDNTGSEMSDEYSEKVESSSSESADS